MANTQPPALTPSWPTLLPDKRPLPAKRDLPVHQASLTQYIFIYQHQQSIINMQFMCKFAISGLDQRKYIKFYFLLFWKLYYFTPFRPQKAHLHVFCDILIVVIGQYMCKFASSVPDKKKYIKIQFSQFLKTLLIYTIQTPKRHIYMYYVTYL